MELPNFNEEKNLWRHGYRFAAGMDEVGRGAFAGPVVAGAVVFGRETVSQNSVLINDSKKLTARRRVIAANWIKDNAIAYGLGQASVAQINRLGIVKATQIAFRKAIAAARKGAKIDFLLIDAFYAPYVKGLRRKNQKAIVKGDAKSVTIAAASIIAKVYRDELMTNLGKLPKYKYYGWDQNKGYGTKTHRNALKKYGVTRLHRSRFVKV